MEETVVAFRLPAAIGQYDSGVPVRFGHLSVSQDGIAWNSGAKHAAWEQIRVVSHRAGGGRDGDVQA